MRFETLGEKQNGAVLFFHAMGVTGESSEPVARCLKDRYFCILPTSTVYCAGQKYTGKADEVRQVEDFLRNHGVTRLKLVAASSIGADLAVAFLTQTALPVEHVFFDGGMVAQIYVQKYPGETGGLILISTGGMDANTLKSLKRKCFFAPLMLWYMKHGNYEKLKPTLMLGHKKPDTTRKYYLNIDMNKYKGRIIGTLDGLYDFHDKIPVAPEPKDYIETIDSKGRTTKWMKSPKE